jgi:hypothetical protein
VTGGRLSCTSCGNRPICCHVCGANSAELIRVRRCSRTAMKGANAAAIMYGGNSLGAGDDFGIGRGMRICVTANANSASVGRKCITTRLFMIPFWSRYRF